MGEKTVFILGAGASKPYGYPTNIELRKDICNFYRSDYGEGPIQLPLDLKVYSDLIFDVNIKAYNKFATDFKKSSISSIDLFLSRNPQYEEIGKLAIVKSILFFEMESTFNEDMSNESEDWYSYLYNKITRNIENKESYHATRLCDYSFITFNYDRSLEHFLWESYTHSFTEMDEKSWIECFRNLNIWHVYDQIHYLPFQGRVESHEYKKKVVDSATLLKMAKNIRVIHGDQRVMSEQLRIQRQKIIEAENIIFLGFGFAPENLKILGLPEILETNKKDRHIYATTYGMTKSEIYEIKLIFQNSFKSTGHFEYIEQFMDFGNPSWGCLTALREWNVIK